MSTEKWLAFFDKRQELAKVQLELQQAIDDVAGSLGVAKGAKVVYREQELYVLDYRFSTGYRLWLTLVPPTESGAMPKRTTKAYYCTSDDVKAITPV